MRRLLAVAFLLAVLPSPAHSQTAEGWLAGAVGGWSRGGAPLIGGALGVGVSVTRFTVVEAEASLHEGFVVAVAAGWRVRLGHPSKAGASPSSQRD